MQIVDLVIRRLVENVTLKCKTEIPTSNASRIQEVKFGRFKDDPVNIVTHVAISGGNPENPNELDGIVTIKELDRISLRVPAREIGGGETWWHRGRAQLGCFFIQSGYSEDVAQQVAYEAMGRLAYTIRNTPVIGLVDDYGERAHKVYVYAASFFESGGPPNQFIWRGSVLWQVLTSVP